METVVKAIVEAVVEAVMEAIMKADVVEVVAVERAAIRRAVYPRR